MLALGNLSIYSGQICELGPSDYSNKTMNVQGHIRKDRMVVEQ